MEICFSLRSQEVLFTPGAYSLTILPGWDEKAILKKRKALEDALKCAKLTDLFSRGQTQH